MKLVESKIGDYRLLIESVEEDSVNHISNDRNTEKTGITPTNNNMLVNEAKKIINTIASEFGNELLSINPTPDEIELKFGISLSSEVKAWILTAGNVSNLEVGIKWQKEK